MLNESLYFETYEVIIYTLCRCLINSPITTLKFNQIKSITIDFGFILHIWCFAEEQISQFKSCIELKLGYISMYRSYLSERYRTSIWLS